MPNNNRRFYLYSYISKFADGSELYQIQNGQPRLMVYACKRMLTTTRNHTLTEWVFCGLAMHLVSFSHLLKRVNFDAVVDHLILTHIMKRKSESTTNRMKRLLEVLSLYTISLYYSKGRDRTFSDLLPRIGDMSDPHEVIPISFNSHPILTEYCYTLFYSLSKT